MSETTDHLAACQRDNTRLIARVVELEHALRDAMGYAALLPRGVDPAALAAWRAALGDAAPPPRAHDPPPLCWSCGLPLAGAHIRDEVIVERAGRRASVHRVCADHLAAQGWQAVAQARGL